MTIARVPPDALVPPIGTVLWPKMVPNHGITVVDGIQENGVPALHVAFSTDTPPWVLVGMLETVLADVRLACEHGLFDYIETSDVDEDDL
jgi:hypothetical protein